MKEERTLYNYKEDRAYRADSYVGGYPLNSPYIDIQDIGKGIPDKELDEERPEHREKPQEYFRPPSKSFRWRFVKALLSNRGATFGAIVILLFIAVAVLAPVIAPESYDDIDLPNMLRPPSSEYPMGTDEFGRDLLSRIIYGARVSLKVSIFAVGLSMIIGVTLGAVAGYFGGGIDLVITGLTDIVWSFPVALLAIAFVAAFGPSLRNLVLALSLTGWTGFSRLTRGEFLSLKEMEFISAAKASGIRDSRILLRHMLPNAMGPIIVMATMELPKAIILESSLSFLGLGAQPPTPSWGSIMNTGRSYILDAPWIFFFPGLVMAILVLGYNLFGDGLRDALDPKLDK